MKKNSNNNSNNKIKITFRHSRDVFTKNSHKKWLKDIFPTIRFVGCEYGNHYPSVTVDIADWNLYKTKIINHKKYINHEIDG